MKRRRRARLKRLTDAVLKTIFWLVMLAGIALLVESLARNWPEVWRFLLRILAEFIP